jgi:hypothetical protein
MQTLSRQAQLEEVAGLLTRRLDQQTLCLVIAQLLDVEVAAVPQTPYVRAAELRRMCGNPSKSLWHNWRRDGRIRPGRKVSEGIEIWTREEAAIIAAELIEHQHERDEQRALDGQRQLARRGSAMPVPVQRERRRDRAALVPAPPRDPPP